MADPKENEPDTTEADAVDIQESGAGYGNNAGPQGDEAESSQNGDR